MIYGNGLDAQQISKVADLVVRRPKFVDIILTSAERAVFDARKGKHQIEFLAGRFSIKEAYSKALGTGIGSLVSWHDLEILPNKVGQPVMIKHPKQKTLIAHISISHTGDFVHSSVVLESMGDMLQPVSSRRPAWIEISQSALIHNVEYIRSLTGTQRFFAVVKANAYGHGLAQIVTAAEKANVDGFCVATLDEGIWLRHFGVTKPIMILGVTPAQYAADIAQYDLIPVIVSQQDLRSLLENMPVDSHINVSIGVDTGMGRIGFRDAQELADAVQLIQNQPEKLELQGIGMHFATADGTNQAYFAKQLQRWHDLTDNLNLPDTVWRHMANSGTSLWHEQPSTDLIRVGAGMYGFDASQGALIERDLWPVLSLKAALVHVKRVPAGTSISYGATYTTDQDEWIGTLPIGYADGYSRALQGASGLLPDGRRVTIIGRIAMDQLMVKLPEKLPQGTVVTLIGHIGDEEISLVDLADRLGTIPYEIATSLSARLPRKLVE